MTIAIAVPGDRCGHHRRASDLDLAGHLPPPLGVLGYEGSIVIEGLNELRLLCRSV